MARNIKLKYYDNGTASWLSHDFYYTNYVAAPEITKVTGTAGSGDKYQYTKHKRYTYNVDLFLSNNSPYSTTLVSQIAFLYNFLSNDLQRINFSSDIDVITENNGIIQLDLIENSQYIRTISLTFYDRDPKTGDFT